MTASKLKLQTLWTTVTAKHTTINKTIKLQSDMETRPQ